MDNNITYRFQILTKFTRQMVKESLKDLTWQLSHKSLKTADLALQGNLLSHSGTKSRNMVVTNDQPLVFSEQVPDKDQQIVQT